MINWNLIRSNGHNLPTFDENYKPIDIQCLVNFKHKKNEEHCTQHTVIRFLECSDKIEMFKAARETEKDKKTAHFSQETM